MLCPVRKTTSLLYLLYSILLLLHVLVNHQNFKKEDCTCCPSQSVFSFMLCVCVCVCVCSTVAEWSRPLVLDLRVMSSKLGGTHQSSQLWWVHYPDLLGVQVLYRPCFIVKYGQLRVSTPTHPVVRDIGHVLYM